MTQVNTRALVLDMLLMWEKESEYCNVILRGTLNKYDYLSGQEKAFIKRLFEGCVERSLQIDYILNTFSKTKTTKMKPIIRQLLRMGVYQLLFMDSVPDSAACNETVKLAGKRGFQGLKGFVNGILRSVIRERDNLQWPDEKDGLAKAWSVRYSMPEWLVEKFLSERGKENTQKLLSSFLKQDLVTIRFQEYLSEKERLNYVEQMKQSGVEVTPHPYLPYAYRLENAPGIANVPGFAEGAFFVQDVSSMLVSEIAGIKKEQRILDVCAAPGGKSLHAASKLSGTGLVKSCDLTEYKTAMIEENVQRSGLGNVEIATRDARIPVLEEAESYDIVYADLPCSGLGIMGKKCDIRYRIKPEDLEEIVRLQKEILDTVTAYVKPGGTLIYSTCTINPSENEQQVEYLKGKGFEAQDIREYLPKELRGEASAKEGMLQLLPGTHETDGFFLARLCKK